MPHQREGERFIDRCPGEVIMLAWGQGDGLRFPVCQQHLKGVRVERQVAALRVLVLMVRDKAAGSCNETCLFMAFADRSLRRRLAQFDCPARNVSLPALVPARQPMEEEEPVTSPDQPVGHQTRRRCAGLRFVLTHGGDCRLFTDEGVVPVWGVVAW